MGIDEHDMPGAGTREEQDTTPTLGNRIQGTTFQVHKMQVDRRQQWKKRERPYPQPERSARKQKIRCQKFHGTCDACVRYGHTAAQCNLLAMSIYINKYMRDITPEIVKTVEKNWAERNGQWLGKGVEAPSKVSKCYTDGVQITLLELEEQTDWDFFDATDEEVEDE